MYASGVPMYSGLANWLYMYPASGVYFPDSPLCRAAVTDIQWQVGSEHHCIPYT